MGMVIYSFTAENADGYTVEITSANGTSALTVLKLFSKKLCNLLANGKLLFHTPSALIEKAKFITKE